jgi:hypothetical protein
VNWPTSTIGIDPVAQEASSEASQRIGTATARMFVRASGDESRPCLHDARRFPPLHAFGRINYGGTEPIGRRSEDRVCTKAAQSGVSDANQLPRDAC